MAPHRDSSCQSERFCVWFGSICKGTINADMYLKECLQKRKSPFILEYYQADKVSFWPDMATSHHVQPCVEWLSSKTRVCIK